MKAYLIKGHGAEGTGTFIVPKGCTIVAKSHVGQLNNRLYENIIGLCKINKELIKDPVTNSNELIKNIGSVVIFKEGDTCPNFEYTLLSCYLENPFDARSNYMYCNESSGLIELTSDTKECKPTIDALYNIQQADKKRYSDSAINEKSISNYVINLFNNSVYPTKDQIKTEVKKILKEYSLETHHGIQYEWMKLDYILKKLNKYDKILVSQETLCSVLPGVYYNFVCRYIDNVTSKIYESYNRVQNFNPVLLNNSILKKNVIGNTLRKRLSETINKRTPLVSKYYKSSNFVIPENYNANSNLPMTNEMLASEGWVKETKHIPIPTLFRRTGRTELPNGFQNITIYKKGDEIMYTRPTYTKKTRITHSFSNTPEGSYTKKTNNAGKTKFTKIGGKTRKKRHATP